MPPRTGRDSHKEKTIIRASKVIVPVLTLVGGAIVAGVVTYLVMGGRPSGVKPTEPLPPASIGGPPQTQPAEAQSPPSVVGLPETRPAEPAVSIADRPEPSPGPPVDTPPASQAARSEPEPAIPPTPPPPPSQPAVVVADAPVPADQELSARRERFARLRDEGVAALARKDYPAAIQALTTALKEQDDAEVRALLEEAIERNTKPRLAVAELSVTGDVGIPDAGKSVAELLLARFDPQQFQLVERTQLAAILKEHDLALADITENPAILRVKKLKGVRYLVVGSVTRLGNLSVSARLVDVVTADVVQTAEVSAEDARGLQEALGELAYMLQLSPEQKASYLEEKRRRMEAVAQADAAAKAAAEAEMRARLEEEHRRQRFEEFRARERMREANVRMADIKAALSRGEYETARRLSESAVREYADTPLAQPFGDLQAAAEREVTAQREAQARRTSEERRHMEDEHRRRLERFRHWRDRGLAALSARDYPAAVEAFHRALNEHDDADARALLGRLMERTSAPGLAVLDFQVVGDFGLHDGGRSIAAYLLARFGQDPKAYRPVDRQTLLAAMAQANLTPADLTSDPPSPSVRRIRGVRYLVCGKATRTDRVDLSARLVDLTVGKVIRTANASVSGIGQLQSALGELAAALQRSDTPSPGTPVTPPTPPPPRSAGLGEPVPTPGEVRPPPPPRRTAPVLPTRSVTPTPPAAIGGPYQRPPSRSAPEPLKRPKDLPRTETTSRPVLSAPSKAPLTTSKAPPVTSRSAGVPKFEPTTRPGPLRKLKRPTNR